MATQVDILYLLAGVSCLCVYKIFTESIHFFLHTQSLSCFAELTLVNPRRACAARVTVLGLCVCVCVCVCVSVSTYSLPTATKPAHQQYQWL